MTKIGSISVTRKGQVRVMGILNVSPESFYKGSVKTTTKGIARAAIAMQQEGAHIVDIGAMSTAPYLLNTISSEKEIERLVRAIKIVRNNCGLPISVDTPRSKVAREAIQVGVDCINDVTGFKYDSNIADTVAESKLPVIVGAYGRKKTNHSQSKPTKIVEISGTISGTTRLLKESLLIAKKKGIQNEKIVIDPSIGFFRANGKNSFFTPMKDSPWYNRDLEVIARLHELEKSFSNPICTSVSRKSFIGEILGLNTEQRLIPSLVFEIVSAFNGAKIIRTHDVKETVQALKVCKLIG